GWVEAVGSAWCRCRVGDSVEYLVFHPDEETIIGIDDSKADDMINRRKETVDERVGISSKEKVCSGSNRKTRQGIEGDNDGARASCFGSPELEPADIDVSVHDDLEPFAEGIADCARIGHVFANDKISNFREDFYAAHAIVITHRAFSGL